ncbi:hypothetical protein ABZ318_32960 [Streptomyces sp. NPDC006197]|uniref:hypothetical protein n=1 Tax=Streptomyces sp. NPDC006197 TaxID=3156685 RepID=UPI0033B7BE51
MQRTIRLLLAFCSVLGLGLVTGGVAQAAEAGEKVCYRAHIANVGWTQGWKCDGGQAGYTGQNTPIEALEIQIWGLGTFCADAHLRDFGDQAPQCASDGQVIRVGTTGEARPMEQVSIRPSYLGLWGRAHVQNVGWEKPDSGSEIEIGEAGKALNLEAVELWIQ